ncbi:TetR/AcrR family transcriptional repressor of nem operon [Streptomyces sp. B3I7]|uniref:TetR/AcrR family transcriptional regulator n=1 Tax=unclassified Streptomyces TaxID=2593676 RepID=UPI002781BF00|nr:MULTISPECIES: TetR/AcrR family transcriptional regulator [unclassified Streptomyces]MDQ0787659.1 TetR/AcrR family transcriptional repressor of nem operon [Streptomyces sp. B3I8]MDQ0812779.1 TetR/AcrR family transcriptional repressor of nem operon [Streptomyces sp. B3I7]
MPRPRAFDEREVLARAREQFWATGYAGTRMDDIARATGLGKGSLYGAFGDKGALFHRVFGDWCAAVVEVAEGRLAGGPDAEAMERLSGYVRLMAENTASDTGRRGCLMAKGTAELAQQDPTVAGRSAETMTALLTLLRTEIAAAQRHGDIDGDADPERLAALLLTVVRGIEAVGKAGLDPETVRGVADTALAVLPRPATRKAPATGHAPDREA